VDIAHQAGECARRCPLCDHVGDRAVGRLTSTVRAV